MYLLADIHSRIFEETFLGLHLTQREMYLLLAPQVHGVFFLIALSSNILQNAQLQKPIANYIIRRLLSLLKNWKLSSLSCMHEELQAKVICLCMIFGLKEGECHCAKVLRPETDFVKSSVSFVLL